MRRIFLLILPLLFLAGTLGPGRAEAQGGRKGDIVFVETDVDLRRDGSAEVAYTVQWRVVGDRLRGFLFSGNDRLEVGPFSEKSHAVDDAGRRYALDIGRMRPDVYEILLADGAGVRSGNVTYRFWFPTDFARAGYLAPTRAEDGRELAVFHWSPVQWDEAERQRHYTLRVHTPHRFPAGFDPREHVLENDLVLTEPWVNERFRIDYQRGEHDRLVLLFHRDRPGNRYSMRVQFYMPAEWFDGLGPADPSRPTPFSAPLVPDGPRTPDPARPVTRPATRPDRPAPSAPGVFGRHTDMLFLPGAAALLALFYMAMAGKQRSMIKAHRGLDEIRWDTLDWTPPKLVLSNFRVKGKVCKDLTPLEAAFYLEVPFRQILSALFRSLEREGYLAVTAEKPTLKARVLRTPDLRMDPYERMLVKAFADDGELSQKELEDIMNLAIRTIQQKAWDCDVEATRLYWEARIDEFEKDEREAAAARYGREDVGYNRWYWWYHNRSGHYEKRYEYETDPWQYETAIPVDSDHLQRSFFDTSPAFDLNVCHDACHSACHSACVSGGSR